jgi:voltage-gated potassium channel Kch
LLVYYGLPLRAEHLSDVARLIVFAMGVVGLMWLIARQIRRYVAGPSATSGRLLGVLTVIYAVTVFFALCYYLIERNTPGQFAGLSTRTDALYYTVVTLGTVGYGDVHAVGQAARAVTMVQITFDLVVIGVLVAVASAQLADRLRAARESRSPVPGDEAKRADRDG